MQRSTNPTAHHFELTRDGVHVAADKIGANAGVAAFDRMVRRLADAAGVDRFTGHTIDESTGDLTFAGGFRLARVHRL